MKRFMKFCAKSLVVILLIVIAYKIAYPSYSWHQKLTIEVETPEGLVSGSSVVAVQWTVGPRVLLDTSSVGRTFQGEATVLMLPDGRYLFALLERDTPALALYAFESSKVTDSLTVRFELASEINDRHGEVGFLPEHAYPLLITFTDINDSTTIKRIDPDNLVESFGVGYSLKNITIEITNEPVTWGRMNDFDFMKKLKTQRFISSLPQYDEKFPDKIYYLTEKAFRQGEM